MLVTAFDAACKPDDVAAYVELGLGGALFELPTQREEGTLRVPDSMAAVVVRGR
ncbi:hypothetical protein ABZT51_09125 [Streptomyces sp. NPDC005373]|uniref:hypothetical protein n=1 Tax=Streptomyces sp. NPDC005373 TaxID=3156879 RepID=UPI0033AD41B8